MPAISKINCQPLTNGMNSRNIAFQSNAKKPDKQDIEAGIEEAEDIVSTIADNLPEKESRLGKIAKPAVITLVGISGAVAGAFSGKLATYVAKFTSSKLLPLIHIDAPKYANKVVDRVAQSLAQMKKASSNYKPTAKTPIKNFAYKIADGASGLVERLTKGAQDAVKTQLKSKRRKLTSDKSLIELGRARVQDLGQKIFAAGGALIGGYEATKKAIKSTNEDASPKELLTENFSIAARALATGI